MKKLLPILLLALLAACSDPAAETTSTTDSTTSGDTSGKPVVRTVNYPLTYFAERLGDDAYRVAFPQIDGDPAFWQPNDSDIVALQAADLILLNGATYAKWRDHVSLPQSTVDTSASFKDRYIHVDGSKTHSHGGEGEHSHGGIAFTTWLDFGLARLQARAVADALGKLQPPAAKRIESAWSELEADLIKLDEDMAELAFAIGDQPLIASHPVYQYFARAYNLDIKSVHWEPETVPDEAAMAEFVKLYEDHTSAWMIWEGEPAPASVKKLEELGVKSVVFDPCGNRPDDNGTYRDWLTIMRQNLENLRPLAL